MRQQGHKIRAGVDTTARNGDESYCIPIVFLFSVVGQQAKLKKKHATRKRNTIIASNRPDFPFACNR